MRIGIDARFYGPFGKGLGRYTQRLIENLADIDHENDYVLFLRKDNFGQCQLSNPRFEKVIVDVRWYTLAEQWKIPFAIARAKVDLMHFPHFNIPIIAGIPYVATIHDLILNHFSTERATTLSPMLYRFKVMAYNFVLRRAIRNARRILTVSAYSKSQILKTYPMDPDRVVVAHEAALLPPPDDQERRPDDQERIASLYGIRNPYLLFVGNAYPYKNLETLLEVWKTLKADGRCDLHLVLVGKMDYFYLRLKDRAWKSGLDDLVHFVGYVPDDYLPLFYRSAWAYLFPSLEEGFGLPGLEAMSYGTPVLSSNTPCLVEVLGDAPLFFDPKDISGIIKAIDRLKNDPELRAQMMKRGFERIRHFSWRTLAEKTLAAYAQAVSTSPAKHDRGD